MLTVVISVKIWREHIWWKLQLSWKSMQITVKNRLNSPKNHTYRWNDIQSCKIFYPNLTSFVRYKITNFKLENCPDDLLEIYYFYMSQKSWVWTRYFTRLCIIILSTCVIFLVNFDDFSVMVCMGFHERCGFHQIRCLFGRVHVFPQVWLLKTRVLWNLALNSSNYSKLCKIQIYFQSVVFTICLYGMLTSAILSTWYATLHCIYR